MTKRTFFLTYAWAERGRLAALLALTLAATGAALASPQIVRRFLDQAQAGTEPGRLLWTALAFMALALAAQGLNLARTYLGELVAWRATNKLREDLAAHCLALDMDFHKTHKPGELMERLDNDVNETRAYFSTLFTELVSTGCLFVGVIVFLWLEDWRLGTSAMFVSVVVLAVFPRINKARVPLIANVREVHAALSGDLQEWVQGREDIQASGSTGVMLDRLEGRYGERYRVSLALLPVNTVSNVLPGVVLFSAYALAYTLSSGAFGGALSVSAFAMVLMYIAKLENPIYMIQESFMWAATAQASLERIADLLGQRPRLSPGRATLKPSGGLGVRLESVFFGYDDENVLHGVSLDIAPGQSLGLLGRTGSGKTTVARLIARMYDPVRGRVVLSDGNTEASPAELDPACLRSMVAMVTQEVELFNASVRDNITLFNQEIPDDRIWEALRSVGMDGWVWGKPGCLAYKLNGIHGLSAGEAQLLALARVFLSDPALVVMDEASSRLDPATERAMRNAVSALLRGRSAVIIAHRLETLRDVDTIAVLEEGRVIEFGRRVDLEERQDSRYGALLRAGLEEALA